MCGARHGTTNSGMERGAAINRFAAAERHVCLPTTCPLPQHLSPVNNIFCARQAERAKLEKAVEDELAAEAAADEAAKQQKREQIAAEEQRLQQLEEQRQAEVGSSCVCVCVCWTLDVPAVCVSMCSIPDPKNMSARGWLRAVMLKQRRCLCAGMLCADPVLHTAALMHGVMLLVRMCRSLRQRVLGRRRIGGSMRRTSKSCRRSWRPRKRRSAGGCVWGVLTMNSSMCLCVQCSAGHTAEVGLHAAREGTESAS